MTAPRGAELGWGDAKPPIPHTATRLRALAAAGTANPPPTEAHGEVHATHLPSGASLALPVLARSLPSTNQPLDPLRTIAPVGCPPPAGLPNDTEFDTRQLSCPTGELATVAPNDLFCAMT